MLFVYFVLLRKNMRFVFCDFFFFLALKGKNEKMNECRARVKRRFKMKQPDPYFHSAHLLSGAKVTVYFAECWGASEEERHRVTSGERESSSAWLSSIWDQWGQEAPEENRYIISLHLRPWTCHRPKTYCGAPGGPTQPPPWPPHPGGRVKGGQRAEKR